MVQSQWPPASIPDVIWRRRNLGDQSLGVHALNAVSLRLHHEADRLFINTNEAEAKVDFLDLGDSAGDFWPCRIKSVERLRGHLEIAPSRSRDGHSRDGHRCRFLFLHAAHSRDRLKISFEMLKLCFAHPDFRVIPEFVDFLFPFGSRMYAEDFYFSGFRHRTQLREQLSNKASTTSPIRQGFQICWNLKSVEPSDSDDWSIRQCAVHHAFDVQDVQTSWIVVKGDELMKRRIEPSTTDRGHLEAADFKSVDRAFEASLETHLVFCDWSAENWRWYINFLEEKFQNMTRGTFSTSIRMPILPRAGTEQFKMGPRVNTGETERSKFSIFSRNQTQSTEMKSSKVQTKHQSSVPRIHTSSGARISQPLPPSDDDDDDDHVEPSFLPTLPHTKGGDDSRDFSFSKLRKVHQIAEKADEAVLILQQNINILTQLREYYRSLAKHEYFPKQLATSCKGAIDGFEMSLRGLESDMQSQILRLQTLLRLLEDRKTLHRNILEYQNTQASKYSTKSIFTMTEDMNDIARKTKIETVSMKVITLVTLFFLPGTFISVGRIFLSTLMSTDIFQSGRDPDYSISGRPNPYTHLSPVQIYLALSLPLTVAILLSWAAFHYWEMRHEKEKQRHHKEAGWQV